MKTHQKTLIRLSAISLLLVTLGAYATYKQWGYEIYEITHTQGIKVKGQLYGTFPEGGSYVYTKYKKASWLPGADIIVGPLTKEEYYTMKETAVLAERFEDDLAYGESCRLKKTFSEYASRLNQLGRTHNQSLE